MCIRDRAKTSPLAKYFDESQLNPDYVEWVENGKQGAMPTYQDFSYLTKSYARLGAMQNALLPEEYDLRDYGKVEPVLDQNPLGICWAIAANSAAASPLMEQFPQTSFSPIHTTWSVSYTHLDVYKRQMGHCLSMRAFLFL